MLNRPWKKYQTGFAQLTHLATGFGQLQPTSTKQVKMSDPFSRVEIDRLQLVGKFRNFGNHAGVCASRRCGSVFCLWSSSSLLDGFDFTCA